MYVPKGICTSNHDAFISANFKTFSEAMPLLPSHGKTNYPQTPKSLKLILCTDPRLLWHWAAVWTVRNDQVLRKREVPASPPPSRHSFECPTLLFQSHLELQDDEITPGAGRGDKKNKPGNLSTQNKSSQERGNYLKAEFGGTGEMVQQLRPKFCFRYTHQAENSGPPLYLQGDLTPSGHLSTSSPMQIFF